MYINLILQERDISTWAVATEDENITYSVYNSYITGIDISTWAVATEDGHITYSVYNSSFAGIDISTWAVATEDEHITYSVWDFAGQTVYYNTHQVTGLQIRVCTRKLFFLFLNRNICCGYSKEPSR